jgi:y4mF family transcriptional regulator
VIIQTNYQLGAALKGRRQQLGLTQRELAERAGIGLRSLKEIESGEGNPRLDSLFKFFAALGLDMIAEPTPTDPDDILQSVLQRTRKQ